MTMFLSGCISLDTKPSEPLEEKFYLYDLKMKVNDLWYVGFGMPNKSADSKYRIEIEPPGSKIDRLIITTCHRQDVIDKPDSIGWSNKSVLYDYSNVMDIESTRTCPMTISAIEEKSRKVAFGFLDFIDSRSEYDLGAKSQCNGKLSYFKGRGYCQSAADLVQVIEFYEDVIVTPASQGENCQIFSAKPQRRFEFKMPKGLCTYQFVSKYRSMDGQKRSRLRFYTYGLTDVPVRF